MRGRVARASSGGQGRWCDETEARERPRENLTLKGLNRVATFPRFILAMICVVSFAERPRLS